MGQGLRMTPDLFVKKILLVPRQVKEVVWQEQRWLPLVGLE